MAGGHGHRLIVEYDPGNNTYRLPPEHAAFLTRKANPDRVLQEIAKALRPDGTFLMQDIAASSYVHKNIDHPIGPLLYTLSCMSCMTVSLAANGAGLGAMWGEEKAREMLKEAGFAKVDVKKLPHDFQNAFYIIQKN